MVFPHEIKDGDSLDDHFWANKRIVLLLLLAANSLAMLMTLWGNFGKPNVTLLLINYAVDIALYVGLVVPAALATRARLVFWTLGAHVIIYLLLAVCRVSRRRCPHRIRLRLPRRAHPPEPERFRPRVSR